jgi:hypothetical protein
MKVWFEGKVVYYDMIINDITPNWIELDDTIVELKTTDNHVFIKGSEENWIIQNITDPHRTMVFNMRLRRHPLFLDDIFKQEFPHKA